MYWFSVSFISQIFIDFLHFDYLLINGHLYICIHILAIMNNAAMDFYSYFCLNVCLSGLGSKSKGGLIESLNDLHKESPNYFTQ